VIGRQDERGAAAVELALVLPVLLLILFGIIEYSLMFKDSLTMASTSRAGARMASAAPRSPTMAEDTISSVLSSLEALPDGAIEEVWIYQADADGEPECTTDTCYRYVANGDELRLMDGYAWEVADRNACVGDPEADRVGVYVRAERAFLSGFFPGSMTLTDHTVMRLEPVTSLEGCRG